MIYFSICSIQGKQPKSLSKLIDYCKSTDYTDIKVTYDAKSIYDGHQQNIDFFKRMNLVDDDIIVLCHDDLEIISKPDDLRQHLNVARKPNVGFVGLAGSCHLPLDGAWWNARRTGDARGFVFQGDSHETMTPNYFGKSGQVVFLDGCFLAATYKTIKAVGLSEPKYLETGWDFYDIHLTHKAHLDGFCNYVVPIIAMHESPGMMREGWFNAKEKFMRKHASILNYSKLPTEKTHGLP
tara:strand:- start:546 stop:1259 length:714 start_codon:yes stop_codon:yes gene_type:complete